MTLTLSPSDLAALRQLVGPSAAAGPGSQQQQAQAAVTAALLARGMTIDEDALEFRGDKFVLPKVFDGDVRKAIQFLEKHEKQGAQPFTISRTFRYRPYDGAHAFMQVLRELSGTTGFGVTKKTFFGEILPRFETINVSATETVQVPQGTIAYPPYEAEFNLYGVRDEEFGPLCRIDVKAPRKWRKHIEHIFTLMEQYLANGSIYRSKAINGAEAPEFITIAVDENRIAYPDEVLHQLGAHLWTPIQHADLMRDLGVPLRRAVLLAGPYGSGKTVAGLLTGKKAVENGWTFIHCRPGHDDPEDVLQTARLYAPAVVLIEDIDVQFDGADAEDLSELLEMLDGASSKGGEIVAIFTTNHIGKLHKGVLRPGRIDAVIEIDGLDQATLRALVERHVRAENLGEVDYGVAYVAFEGFQPAFAVEAINRALRFAVHRNNGKIGKVTTQDLIDAADGLRPQLQLMAGAKETASGVTFENILTKGLATVLTRTRMPNVDEPFQVEEPALNGRR